MKVNSFLVYGLPPISNPNGYTYTVAINFGLASTFVEYENGIFAFSPGANNTGVYPIIITITDTNPTPQKITYTFKLTVEAKKKPKNTTDELTETEVTFNPTT